MPQIPAGWKETTLEKKIFIQPWFAFKSSDFEWISNSFVVKIKNIQPPFVVLNSNDTVNILNYSHEKLEKFVVKRGDYLVAMTWETIWKVGKYLLDFDSYLNQRVCKFVDMQKADYKFIYYTLLNSSFQKYINAFSFGAAQANISTTEIWNFQIHLPPLPEQQAIAAVLSPFDDKIELLRAENQTLEQMGQELFKERFGKWKVGDELPEGWRVGKIEDLTNYIASWGTPATKEASYYGWRINWFSTKELQDCFLFSSEKTITEDALKNSSAKEFPKDTVLMAIYAAPTVWRLWILTQSSAFNQAAVGLVAKDDIWMPFIYLLLKFHRDNFNNLANWAAQQNLNVSLVKNYEIPIPDQETLNQFDLVIKPLFNKIRANSEQIQSLSATRDLLLPKLMSGEVRVEF